MFPGAAYLGKARGEVGGKWGEKKGEGRTSEERGRELKILGIRSAPSGQPVLPPSSFASPQQEHALGY